MSEFDELNNDPELTQEKLQEKLNSYAEALRSEFEESTKESPENVEEYTRDFFKKNIHHAAAQIVWLAANSTSDSVRLRASQIVVSEALTDARADGDPIKDILAELAKK
jgi:2-keto-4-pentenoate hydratase